MRAEAQKRQQARKAQQVRARELGQRPHPRNIYRDSPPDFGTLAGRVPSFRKYVREPPPRSKKLKPWMDFKDPHALRELLVALLAVDLRLNLDIPVDRLIPTLTLRLNYIHFIEDLLLLSVRERELERVRNGARGSGAPQGAAAGSEEFVDDAVWLARLIPEGPHIRGLDIGVGASCIYPLLGARMHDWSFVGTDVDPVALNVSFTCSAPASLCPLSVESPCA